MYTNRRKDDDDDDDDNVYLLLLLFFVPFLLSMSDDYESSAVKGDLIVGSLAGAALAAYKVMDPWSSTLRSVSDDGHVAVFALLSACLFVLSTGVGVGVNAVFQAASRTATAAWKRERNAAV